jgi:hypothetical protein
MTGTVPSSRVEVAEYKEGVSTTEFGEISGWSSFTSSVPSLDNEYVIDSTVQAGQPTAIHLVVLLTDDEASNLQDVSSGGAGMGPLGGGAGGFIDWLIGLPGIIMAAVGGLIGRSRGWF